MIIDEWDIYKRLLIASAEADIMIPLMSPREMAEWLTALITAYQYIIDRRWATLGEWDGLPEAPGPTEADVITDPATLIALEELGCTIDNMQPYTSDIMAYDPQRGAKIAAALRDWMEAHEGGGEIVEYCGACLTTLAQCMWEVWVGPLWELEWEEPAEDKVLRKLAHYGLIPHIPMGQDPRARFVRRQILADLAEMERLRGGDC